MDRGADGTSSTLLRYISTAQRIGSCQLPFGIQLRSMYVARRQCSTQFSKNFYDDNFWSPESPNILSRNSRFKQKQFTDQYLTNNSCSNILVLLALFAFLWFISQWQIYTLLKMVETLKVLNSTLWKVIKTSSLSRSLSILLPLASAIVSEK